MFLPYIFILIGAVAAAGCLHSLLHKQTVRISADGIMLGETLFRIIFCSAIYSAGKIQYLALKQSYSTQHQGKYKTFYKLQACLAIGKPSQLPAQLPARRQLNIGWSAFVHSRLWLSLAE